MEQGVRGSKESCLRPSTSSARLLRALFADKPTPMSSTPRTLAIAGELDLNRVPVVREQLAALISGKAPRILLDLTGLTYIDSSGLALFIESLQRMQSYGGKLALFGLSDTVRHILEIARLDQIFEIHPDAQSALAKP